MNARPFNTFFNLTNPSLLVAGAMLLASGLTGCFEVGVGTGGGYGYCNADSNADFGSTVCDAFYDADDVPNAFAVGIVDNGAQVQQVVWTLILEVGDDDERTVSAVSYAPTVDWNGDEMFGITLPNASYEDTDIEIYASIELTNGYVIESICEWNGGVTIELDGESMSLVDSGSGEDCNYRAWW